MPKETTSEKRFILEDLEQMREHLLSILQQGKKKVSLYSSDLNPALFNTDEFRDALSTLARSHSKAEINILIEDPKAIIDANHQVMHLYRRIPSKIAMRKLIIDPPESHQFMLVDTNKIWLQHKASEYTGFANYDARPDVTRFDNVFKNMWKHSEESPTLRRLSF